MLVVSFFAPRLDVWGCDYDALLHVLDASCKRLGLRHVVISDRYRPGLDTAIFRLPENLMQAFLDGQRQFLEQVSEPVLLVGADCVLTRDPRPFAKGDMTVTVGPFLDCPLNTGAIWVSNPQAMAHIWRNAMVGNPTDWGDDQKTLYAAICRAMIRGADIHEVAALEHNWAPESVEDDAGMPTVAHFRGPRKAFMADWYQRHVVGEGSARLTSFGATHAAGGLELGDAHHPIDRSTAGPFDLPRITQ